MIYLHFVCTLLHFTQIENICRIQKISGLQPTELEGVTFQIREMDNDRVERDVGETGFTFFGWGSHSWEVPSFFTVLSQQGESQLLLVSHHSKVQGHFLSNIP